MLSVDVGITVGDSARGNDGGGGSRLFEQSEIGL